MNNASTPRIFPSRMAAALFFLSAAALSFEINLLRLFSVAQFYHFAFMIVSTALLGSGASGTALSFFPDLSRQAGSDPRRISRRLGILAMATGISILAAYLFTNALPFDSFSIAWDRRQALLLGLHYLALAAPFFFSGLAVGMLLAASPRQAGRTYAANLLGSALGCLIALPAPSWLGGEGTVALSACLACAGCLICDPGISRKHIFIALALLAFSLADMGLRLTGRASFSFMELRISPYKSLSYALQVPGSQVVFRRWNASSRVDVVRSQGIHSLPGLSYRYAQPPPPQDGLLVDGDDLSPVVWPEVMPDFADYLPQAIAYRLRPGAEVLILEPRGGLDLLAALALGARQVTAVEENALIVSAVKGPYTHPRVQVIVESSRSHLRRAEQTFDVILVSLTSSYHPVRSGAYSLAEDYRYTVEAFTEAFRRLNPQGLLVVTRWLQTPPSECLRAFALAVTALEKSGVDPQASIVALRGYNTATILVKRTPFLPAELQEIRDFSASRAFDLIYAPGVRAEETNQYNILPEPIYYQAFVDLLQTRPRQDFYEAYAFDVRPPTDDHPFFGHYFKWSQAGEVLAGLGRTWQPFGGAGYFVVLAVLLLAVLTSAGLILLPALARKRPVAGWPASPRRRDLPAPLAYFILIGLAYLLVEMPLIQRFILYLGRPAPAATMVLFSLLLFSGLGSRWSERQGSQKWTRPALVSLVTALLVLPLGLSPLFDRTLGLPLALRFTITGLVLAPVGFLMGLPFPGGVRWLAEERNQGAAIPWMWAANGAASVVSAVLAALLALTFGFQWVFWTGAMCYAGALMVMGR